MGNIDWVPIEECPDRLKNGRFLLLWDGQRPHTAFWFDRGPRAGWETYDGDWIAKPTHFAEINAPSPD